MKKHNLSVLIVVLSATIAAAHSGVQNKAVKARMDAMGDIAAEMKTLGLMANGAVGFDADVARDAAADIAHHAARTPALFKAEEDDPRSEAKPDIWSDFADFTAKSDALETVAFGLSTSIMTLDDLKPAMAALGATCKACHSAYRE